MRLKSRQKLFCFWLRMIRPTSTRSSWSSIVDPPIPLALAHGSALIQYRAENVRISPVFGPAALNVFPRVGHLHINVDGLPWHWADASNTGTIDIKDLPPGQHKVTIDLVDANHQLFPGQSITITFTMPQTSETH